MAPPGAPLPVEISDNAPELLTADIDTYVPPDVEQRLIQYWLRYGPIEWRSEYVMQAIADALPDNPTAEFHILHPTARRRRIGHEDDGVWRMIRVPD